MPDSEEFFSHQGEHSRVKAGIVEKYFPAWCQIMIPRSRPGFVVYLDLYAGPGSYVDGAPSTPILVTKQVAANPKLSGHVKLIFNDMNGAHCEQLQTAIDAIAAVKKLRYRPVVVNTPVDEVVAEVLGATRLAPTFSFVDPFGFKGLTKDLITGLIKDWGCECLFFFNFARVRMALQNPFMRKHMDALFGADRVADLHKRWNGLSAEERETAVLGELSAALKEAGGQYILPFRFRPATIDRPYHLVFVTKNILGYTIMKEVQRAQATGNSYITGTYEFIPADHHYPTLFALNALPDELAAQLLTDFAGHSVSVVDLFQCHHVGTPFVKADYKKALLGLLAGGKISKDDGGKRRRPGTLADDVIVTFH